MHHGGECRHGQNVTRHFDGSLSGRALDFLDAARVGHRTHMPNLAEDSAGFRLEDAREFSVTRPRTGNCVLVNRPIRRAKTAVFGRNVRLSAIEADVSLALLFGIVERMGVKEGPYKLSAHVLEAKFEMRVLIYGVMPAIKSGRADIDALLFRDFFRANDPRRIARARGSDGRIVWMRERVAQRHARRGRFDWLAWEGGQGMGHERTPFYTESRTAVSTVARYEQNSPAHASKYVDSAILRTRRGRDAWRKADCTASSALAYHFGEYGSTIYTFQASGYPRERQLNRGSG